MCYKVPGLKKERSRHKKEKKVVVVILSKENLRTFFWIFLGAKEKHYFGLSSRIKGLEWIGVALVHSVVYVKGEGILWILQRKLLRGNMSENWENSGSDSTMKVEALKAEKRALKAAITRQLNELADRVAGVSGAVEPKNLAEMEGIKASLKRLETIKKKKTFEILEELRTLYQPQKENEIQVKDGDELKVKLATLVVSTFTRNIHPVSPPSYSSNSNTSLAPRNGNSGWNNLERIRFQHLAGTRRNLISAMECNVYKFCRCNCSVCSVQNVDIGDMFSGRSFGNDQRFMFRSRKHVCYC